MNKKSMQDYILFSDSSCSRKENQEPRFNVQGTEWGRGHSGLDSNIFSQVSVLVGITMSDSLTIAYSYHEF